MKFTKHYRFDQPCWFSGIYKIVQYEWSNNGPCKPYYQVYKLNHKQWGDYIDRSKQHDKKLTFKQAVALAKEHAKTNHPYPKRLKQAELAKNSWLAMDKSNAA